MVYKLNKNAETSKKVGETAKKNSLIIGLLPSQKIKDSIKFLFKREKVRTHFKGMSQIELLNKVKKDYKKHPRRLKDICDFIVYTKKPGKHS